jgi:hypothetical protein
MKAKRLRKKQWTKACEQALVFSRKFHQLSLAAIDQHRIEALPDGFFRHTFTVSHRDPFADS